MEIDLLKSRWKERPVRNSLFQTCASFEFCSLGTWKRNGKQFRNALTKEHTVRFPFLHPWEDDSPPPPLIFLKLNADVQVWQPLARMKQTTLRKISFRGWVRGRGWKMENFSYAPPFFMLWRRLPVNENVHPCFVGWLNGIKTPRPCLVFSVIIAAVHIRAGAW